MTIEQIQQAITVRLTAVDGTVPAPVSANGAVQWLTEDIGDLGNTITRTIGSLGIIGTVLTPSGKLIQAGQGPGIAINALIEVQIQENVMVNRGAGGTQISAGTLRDFVMKRLHKWSPTGQRINQLLLDETPYLLVAETPTLVYNVRVNASVTLV